MTERPQWLADHLINIEECLKIMNIKQSAFHRFVKKYNIEHMRIFTGHYYNRNDIMRVINEMQKGNKNNS